MNDFQLTNPENPDLCDPALSQWFTPHALAERIVEWAVDPFYLGSDIRPLPVLEPSCGRGALVAHLSLRGCDVVGIDIDKGNVDWCAENWRGPHRFEHADFLSIPGGSSLIGTFPLAVLNPPFEAGQTEAHVLHAMKFAGRVVCHCPLTTLAGQDRRTGLWSKAYLKRLVIHSSRPKYSGNKAGGATDMCTIDVVAAHAGLPGIVAASGVSVEWWA